jgi:hypothetical protein
MLTLVLRVVLSRRRCFSRYKFSSVSCSANTSRKAFKNMPRSEDEFSAFDLSEFTEDDFKQIDASLDIPKLKGSPKVMVELETPQGPPEGTPTYVTGSTQPTEDSPYQHYRRNGVLSVTDLASLAWFVCVFLKK